MTYQERWEAAKGAINSLLGLGFGPGHIEAREVFTEIDGDFGIPTERDVDGFVRSVCALDPDTARVTGSGVAAIDGRVLVLRLYRAAAFEAVAR